MLGSSSTMKQIGTDAAPPPGPGASAVSLPVCSGCLRSKPSVMPLGRGCEFATSSKPCAEPVKYKFRLETCRKDLIAPGVQAVCEFRQQAALCQVYQP